MDLANEFSRSKTKAQLTAKVLYNMIEDKKCIPFDFEVQLRNFVFDQKQKLEKLKNEDGLSLLHAAVLKARTRFIFPLFRTGSWCELRALRAESGPYEGQTAEDICSTCKYRVLQKEMDLCTKWEKSLNQVHIAARGGNFTEFKKTMRCSGGLHHEVDEMGCTSLYWAVVGKNIDIFKMLLRKKVNHTVLNSRKESLLHVACMMGHWQFLNTLVKEMQMDVSVKDGGNKSALIMIAENGDEGCLARLIKFGVKKEKLSEILAIAGYFGRLEFIKTLVDQHGIDPASKDEKGMTALMRACQQSHIEIVKYLLSKKGVDITEIDVRRQNVLHMAADEAEDAGFVEFLLNEIKKKGELVLQQMINARDVFVGEELCTLIRGKDNGRAVWNYVEVNRDLVDVFMKTCRGGSIDVGKHGAIVVSGWGVDPDEESVREMKWKYEVRRRDAQASVDNFDATPLHIAAFRNKEDIVEVLIKHGSDLNIYDKFGLTPLHVAAMRGNLAIVKSMVVGGAECDLRSNMNKTPADVAEDNDHKTVANFILSYRHIPVAENFRNIILSKAQNLLAEEYIQGLLNSGVDIRIHIINTLRDLTFETNNLIFDLGAPVLKESSAN